MKPKISAILLLLLSVSSVFSASPYVVVLGVGQDAGVPQMGCDSPYCRKAWKDQTLKQTVSCIALVDPDTRERWIFDATPDLPEQFESLKNTTADRSNNITGIFLTHAHIGHYAGLMYLGRESMNTRDVTVFAMPRMKQMLEDNAPWSQLGSIGNIAIRPLAEKMAVNVNSRLSVEPFLVPHRDEFSETVGFRISSGRATLIYLPDIDKWEKWSTPLAQMVKTSDHLLLDGTFFADGEISRPMSEVPHPFVTETMSLLADLPKRERSRVHFIHFNHSNPLVQGDRRALRELRRKGFRMARSKQRFTL
ncbi:MAG: MBL fold metallo-hydrolase [Pyrinomonadaceae bacterium]